LTMNMWPIVSGCEGDMSGIKTIGFHPLTSTKNQLAHCKPASTLTVILSDIARCRNIILHCHPQTSAPNQAPRRFPPTPVESTDPGIMQIQNRATRLDQFPLLLRTSRQSILLKLLVLMNEMFELPLLGGERVELVDVEFAKLLNVDGSTFFVLAMVELGVVFVDFTLFGVVEAVAGRPSIARSQGGRRREEDGGGKEGGEGGR